MLEANEDLRALELERSDVVIARLWPSIDCENPDPKAIEQYLRVCDYRAKIAGLYAPKKTLFSEERPWGPAGAPTRLAAVDELCAATGTWITITDHLVDQAAARYAVVADGPNHRGARAVPDEPDNSPAGDNNAASGSSDTRSAEQTPRSARASGDDGETDIHRGAFHRVPAADSTTQPAPADPPSTIDGHNAGADETPLERAKRRVREGDIPPRTLRLPRRE
jgi:hypothetical protein